MKVISAPTDPADIGEVDKVKLIALYSRVCPEDVLANDDPRRDVIAAEMLDIGLALSPEAAMQVIGAVDRWMTARNELNEAPHADRHEMAPNAEKLSNEARVILHRIELRINPRKNKFEDADKEFLSSLWKLLDPSALPGTSWRTLANTSVKLGRELLKREWEVTKNVFF